MAASYSNISPRFAAELRLTPTDRPGEYFETFTGTTNADVQKQMDDRLAQIQQAEPGTRQERRARIGRNASCWCGSGRKFKKCHLPPAPR
jgi:uncharacterized protein YecA (UPF0149 family)